MTLWYKQFKLESKMLLGATKNYQSMASYPLLAVFSQISSFADDTQNYRN